jgi:CheY-like chemotaxis protein
MRGESEYKLHHRVLIVDDNSDLARSLTWLLEFHGCRVAVAQDGQEGLRKAIGEKPDVILIDISMPGMSGYDVARAIRSSMPYAVFLIAQTAYGSPDDRAMALASGFDEHLIKPAEPGHLIKLIAGCRAFHD